MNKTLIAEFEKASEAYGSSFRPFEVETLDGRRIRITKPFTVQKLYGDADGDIRIKNGTSAFVHYADLKDVIYYLPWWQCLSTWIWQRPELLFAAQIFTFIGIILGAQMRSCCEYHSTPPTEQTHK